MIRFVCHESRYNTYRMADRALSIVRNSKSLVDKIKRMLLICEPLTFVGFSWELCWFRGWRCSKQNEAMASKKDIDCKKASRFIFLWF